MMNQVGPTVVTIPDHPGNIIHTQFKEKVIKGLGVVQIVMGSVILSLAFRFIDGHRMPVMFLLIENGCLYIVTGSFSCVASKRKTQCMILASLILSTASAMCAGAALDPVIKAIWWGKDEDPEDYHIIMSSIVVGLLLVVGIVSLVVSAFGCGTLCCSCCCCGGKQGRPATPPPAYGAPPAPYGAPPPAPAVYAEKQGFQ